MAIRDISFFSEDTSFVLKRKQKVREWIQETVRAEGFERVGSLNFIFCSDAYLIEINRQYLDHDTYTDIVTFDSSEKEGTIAGDIFISVDRIQENALKYGVSEWNELSRVIIHGVLHLCGYTDKDKEAKALMTSKEDLYLSRQVQ